MNPRSRLWIRFGTGSKPGYNLGFHSVGSRTHRARSPRSEAATPHTQTCRTVQVWSVESVDVCAQPIRIGVDRKVIYIYLANDVDILHVGLYGAAQGRHHRSRYPRVVEEIKGF